MNAATCVDCGCRFGSRPAMRRCPDCWDVRHALLAEVRATAKYRSDARAKARGGMPGRFRIRSTFLGYHISWGSCETREEAFIEAGRIMAESPDTSRVSVDEVVRYEIVRDDGMRPACSDPAGSELVAEGFRYALGSREVAA